jgi:predicted membrane channel-forming protein YqfA (hemolysin III family)
MKTLRNVLLLNAVSSGATGILMLVAASLIAQWFGITTTTPIWGVGLFLVGFAAFVGFESRRNPLSASRIRTIIFLDLTWVVTSLLIILFQLFNLSLMGYLLIGAVALWVAAMAYLQNRGLQQMRVSNV